MKCETCQKEFEQKSTSNFCSEKCFEIGGQDEADGAEYAQPFGSSPDPVRIS